MDLAAMDGGSMASVPARLLHGKGRGCEAHRECGIPTASDPYFGSLHCCCVASEGIAWVDEAIPLAPPDIPLTTPTGGGAG
jgi:hypothetical protein